MGNKGRKEEREGRMKEGRKEVGRREEGGRKGGKDLQLTGGKKITVHFRSTKNAALLKACFGY